MTTTNKKTDLQFHAKTAPVMLLTIIIIALCSLAAVQLWQHDVTVTYENRIIENTQVLFLVLATALHALQASRRPANAVDDRLCHHVLAMLCLSIMVREIDIDKLGPQAGWAIAENLIRLGGGAVWIWLLSRVYGRRQSIWHSKASVLCTPASVLTGAGVLLYMASWFFDKSVVPLPADRSQLWEETLQMSATVALFTAALRPISLSSR